MKAAIVFTILFIFSCGQELTTSGRGSSRSGTNAVQCACTMQYDPVCGIKNNQYITYSNACSAQCEGVDFTMGACSQNQPTQSQGSSCNANSGQVCGRVEVQCTQNSPCTTNLNAARLYANECEMQRYGASLRPMNECY